MAFHHPIARAFGTQLRIALPAFATTLFVSALLLFAIQPMFTRMVLPVLGGSPSVWSVAMVFFQAALLIGYGYAHLLARRFSIGQSALIHLAVLAAAAFTLPIGLAQVFAEPPSHDIAFWLVGLFSVSIGLPFVALAASAPLLQSWFAACGHTQSRNPYVLYAASNLGSFAALIAYPLFIESFIPLHTQTWLWSVGFAGLALMISAVGWMTRGALPLHVAIDRDASVGLPERFRWIVLAAIPAGLVIAVTAHISTDVAAAPMLWVVPLALYLLTFVGAFRDPPWFAPRLVVAAVPFLVAPLAISILSGDREYWLPMIALNLAALFALALACHGELYARRPPPARLTEFYLWTSLGGVLGGIFTGLLAPYLFSRTYEYPILIVAGVLALPGAFDGGARNLFRRAAPTLAAIIVVLACALYFDRLADATMIPFQVGLVALVGLMLWQRRDSVRFASLAALAFVITGLWQPGLKVLETTRSFFGVHRVEETSDGRFRVLHHGTTIHGAERIGADPAAPPEPLTYYYFGGPISEGIAGARSAQNGLHQVAVVGLGAGSLACHRQGLERWTFFEIDPEVARLARDPRHFRFLSSCAPDAEIVLGDARLTLAKSPKQFDLIVLDAFSSDAIPVHLLTREALRSYLARLAPRGMILMHISNRHMELGSVAAAVGAAESLAVLIKTDDKAQAFKSDYRAAALVAALARDPNSLGPLRVTDGWKSMPSTVTPWTDDYADLLGAIWRKKLGE